MAVEHYRQNLIDRALKLNFSLADIHPEHLMKKITESTLRANMRNKMAFVLREGRERKKIKDLNKRDEEKRELKR